MSSFIKKAYWKIAAIFFALPIAASAVTGGGLFESPLKEKTIEGLISSITKIAVQVGGSVAVLFIIYSGFKFVTARGNPKELESAKQTFYWTMIGTAVLLGAWVLAEAIKATIEGLG